MRPLVYVGDHINSMVTLTTNHFLTLNPRMNIPEILDDNKEVEYNQYEKSSEKLIKLWLKGQK